MNEFYFYFIRAYVTKFKNSMLLCFMFEKNEIALRFSAMFCGKIINMSWPNERQEIIVAWG